MRVIVFREGEGYRRRERELMKIKGSSKRVGE